KPTPPAFGLRGGLAQPLGNPKGHRVVGDSRSNRSSEVPDVANFGLARPPLIYLGSIVLGLVIHIVWPARLVPPAISTPIGAIVTLAAIALFISAVRTFLAAGTPIPGNRPTSTIVRAVSLSVRAVQASGPPLAVVGWPPNKALQLTGRRRSTCRASQPAGRPGPGWARGASAGWLLVHSRAAGS